MGLGVDDHADFEHLCGVGISMFCGDEMMILRNVLGGLGMRRTFFPLSSFFPLFFFFFFFFSFHFLQKKNDTVHKRRRKKGVEINMHM